MKLSICFSKWLNHFTLSTAEQESSNSPFSTRLYLGDLPYFSHPSGFIVVSCDLIFHFPNHYDVEHLYTWLWAICTSLMKRLLNLLPVYFLTDCLSYFYIIRAIYILLMSFSRHMSCSYFPQSVTCLFIVLTVSFGKQTFLILMTFNLSLKKRDGSFGILPKNLLTPRSYFLSCFLAELYVVLTLTFIPKITLS